MHMSATPTEMAAAERAGFGAATEREATDQTPRLLAVGGILGALGAASCCVIPFALFLAGVSGAWIGNLTALEPYQPLFAAVSLGFIGFGAWRVYRKPVVCADGYCAAPRSDRIANIGLWTAAVMVIVALGFPYAARYFL
jgi:mercuric ion transport protein